MTNGFIHPSQHEFLLKSEVLTVSFNATSGWKFISNDLRELLRKVKGHLESIILQRESFKTDDYLHPEGQTVQY